MLRRAGLRVNVLIGIREDALARLDAFKARIPNLLANSLRLDHLDRAAGAGRDPRPARALQRARSRRTTRVEIEPELVEAVLDEVAAGPRRARAGRVAACRRRRATTTGSRRRTSSSSSSGSGRSRRARLAPAAARDAARARRRRRTSSRTTSSARWPSSRREEKDAAAAMYNYPRHAVGHEDRPPGCAISPATRSIDERETQHVLQRLAAERIVRASRERGGTRATRSSTTSSPTPCSPGGTGTRPNGRSRRSGDDGAR